LHTTCSTLLPALPCATIAWASAAACLAAVARSKPGRRPGGFQVPSRQTMSPWQVCCGRRRWLVCILPPHFILFSTEGMSIFLLPHTRAEPATPIQDPRRESISLNLCIRNPAWDIVVVLIVRLCGKEIFRPGGSALGPRIDERLPWNPDYCCFSASTKRDFIGKYNPPGASRPPGFLPPDRE